MPEQLVKLSGIGCSSKTTAYFVGGAHGFNSVHGRMPSIASGANAANRELTYIGVSGDGDSLSIGLGQLVHAIRRNVNMLYLIENNGVYGLTKGQFSASADIGTKAKKGDVNQTPPIDPVLLALSLGATFVARGFSGDKAQLVPLIQAGMRHNGFALIDVLSPCVTFNDHEGSTKSYAFTREHYHPAMEADFVPPARRDRGRLSGGRARRWACTTAAASCCASSAQYDPTDRAVALQMIQQRLRQDEYLTGLLYIGSDQPEMRRAQRPRPSCPLKSSAVRAPQSRPAGACPRRWSRSSLIRWLAIGARVALAALLVLAATG